MPIGNFPFMRELASGLQNPVAAFTQALQQKQKEEQARQDMMRREAQSEPMRRAKLATELAHGNLYGSQANLARQGAQQAQAEAQRMAAFRQMLAQAQRPQQAQQQMQFLYSF
jgi:hypothetical protein